MEAFNTHRILKGTQGGPKEVSTVYSPGSQHPWQADTHVNNVFFQFSWNLLLTYQKLLEI